MTDVDETFTRRRHRKTPILGKKKQKKNRFIFFLNFIRFVVSILFSALGGIMNLTVKNVRQRGFFFFFSFDVLVRPVCNGAVNVNGQRTLPLTYTTTLL
jgi:hypothetical protein